MNDNAVSAELDVLIIGAGISGISMACHLELTKTHAKYLVLERRQEVGGTWDLFRYPGIRSDSDMFTFGFRFRPWRGTSVLAAGPKIKRYVISTADEFGVTERIRFQRKVIRADWSTESQRWTVAVTREDTGETERYSTRFLVGCTGYYNYDRGYRPDFPGETQFRGQIVHPQFWPEDLDYAGKRIVIIGSGATAVTLVPALLDKAAHVTMLQRTPSYILPVPGKDPIAVGVKAIGGPAALSYGLGRKRNIAIQRGMYDFARNAPTAAKQAIRAIQRVYMSDAMVNEHFTPSYEPWDQRLCFVPDGDLFRALKSGKASIVTDHIETFTETGIRTKSGKQLDADIIVTATGLEIQLLGGCEVYVDGQTKSISDHLFYKGVMLDGVPNFAFVLGYTNQSWTLKADLVSQYFSRLYNFMRTNRFNTVIPEAHDRDRSGKTGKFGSLKSGYVLRALDKFPQQGRRKPWIVVDNFVWDRLTLAYGPIDDGVLQFNGPNPERRVIAGVELSESATRRLRAAEKPKRWLARRM